MTADPCCLEPGNAETNGGTNVKPLGKTHLRVTGLRLARFGSVPSEKHQELQISHQR